VAVNELRGFDEELQEYWQENRHKGRFPVVLLPGRRSSQTENRLAMDYRSLRVQ